MIERSVPLITTTDIMIDYCVGELLHSPTDYFIYSNAAKRLALLILSSIDLRTESLNLLGKSKDSSIDNQWSNDNDSTVTTESCVIVCFTISPSFSNSVTSLILCSIVKDNIAPFIHLDLTPFEYIYSSIIYVLGFNTFIYSSYEHCAIVNDSNLA